LQNKKELKNISQENTLVALSAEDHTLCLENMESAEYVLEKWLIAGKFLA
jgi:hypothetical protein